MKKLKKLNKVFAGDNKAYEKAEAVLKNLQEQKIDQFIEELEANLEKARGMRYVTGLASIVTARKIKDTIILS